MTGGNGTASAQLRTARLDDYPQVRRLEAAHGLLPLAAGDWRDFWRDHPFRDHIPDDWPIGWVLEDASGHVVGSLANVPSLYTFRGQTLVAATGRGWVAAFEHRGNALWLMDEYFNQNHVDLFVNTTVNALAADPFGTFGSTRVPRGDWETAAYWVTAHRGFAAAALRIKDAPFAGLLAYPLGMALRLKDALTASALPPAPAVDLAEADAFDSRFDTFWHELVQRNPEKLLAVRDRRTLTWHFAGSLRVGDAWIFTASRGGLLRAYCVLKRQDHPPSGLRRMRLVDYQSLEPDGDLLPSLLRSALRRCALDGIHVLEHVGADLPKMHSFDRFAPYRRTLPAWPFYYKAARPELDAELRQPDLWDPSTFDGDASL